MTNTLLPVWLGQLLEARASRRTYSADEVLQLRRWGDPADPSAAAVHSAASQTAAWSASLPDTAARDLGPAATRLPTVIFWYQRGVDFADIGRRLSPFGGAWDGERAVVAACGLIAQLLDRTRPHNPATTTWPRRHTENP